MHNLKKILVQTETYDFLLIEKFLTYAVNHIGRKHLKKKTEVHIYGNPDKLHPNLYNLFSSLSKKVEFHEG